MNPADATRFGGANQAGLSSLLDVQVAMPWGDLRGGARAPLPGTCGPDCSQRLYPEGGLKRWKIAPDSNSRGVTPAIQDEVQAWARRRGTVDGPPTMGPVDAGHDYGRSHVFTPGGMETQVGAQTRHANRSQAAAERAAAAKRPALNGLGGDAQLPVRDVSRRQTPRRK